MSINPFEIKPKNYEKTLESLQSMYPKAYDKNDVDPYTKLRIILMNGTEYEAVWFSHQFSRHCNNNDIRRQLETVRRVEQQQQKKISCLKPINESILETTIGYEHLAVDLTAMLAEREKDVYVKSALDFALLEDFDHLYRYANLLEMDQGIHAEKLIGKLAEIMPARPTIAEHRFPADDVKNFVNYKTADPLTKLNIAIITAAEQQTMNYYMNVAGFYSNDLGRKIYSEIGMIEEAHVTQYGCLMDTNCTWLEGLLEHEYTEAYLYYSCYMDETDPKIKKIWEQQFEKEVQHLHMAAEMLRIYEKKDFTEVIPNPVFPELLTFHPSIDYVRNVIKNTVENTGDNEGYININNLSDDHRFFNYNSIINEDVDKSPTHCVIEKHIKDFGKDYRYETKNHPIDSLGDRKVDNVDIGRIKREQ